MLAGDLQEVLQDLVAVLRRDALGMELHAVHGMRLVLQAHDQVIGGLGRDGEPIGDLARREPLRRES